MTIIFKDGVPYSDPLSDDDVLEIREGPKLNVVRELFAELTDAERLDIMSDYCRRCGTADPNCRCQNDS